ncbi:MAG TPA: glutathione S-transferase, partial [Phenylobacterium sp.]|nr:glutathione S-transferase [Phenylobacterium sp.]
MELVIGTKRWSSWSLRPWLALRKTGAAFTEVEIELRQAGT